jgi:hypothetical protein
MAAGQTVRKTDISFIKQTGRQTENTSGVIERQTDRTGRMTSRHLYAG